MLTVLAAWDSLHGLKVDDITKEHTSPASDVLCLFMDMEDDKWQTKDQTKDQMKALSSELGVPLRACSSRALYLAVDEPRDKILNLLLHPIASARGQ